MLLPWQDIAERFFHHCLNINIDCIFILKTLTIQLLYSCYDRPQNERFKRFF